MKTLDWSAFGPALTQDATGQGLIDTMITVTSLDFYARIFLQLGGEATIHTPHELIDLLCAQAQAILARYSDMRKV